MTTRQEVARTIQGHGPGTARKMFGDAIVTDVIVNGSGSTATPTGDCGGGPSCTCGGHGHTHPTPRPPPRPVFDHTSLASITAGLRQAGAQMAALNAQYAAMQGRRLAAQQASLRRGINVPHGQTFDHAAAARGRAASDRAHARQAAGPLATINRRAAEFWAGQQSTGGRR